MYSANYCVISVEVDEARWQSIPIGVAMWSRERDAADVRIITPAERLTGIRPELTPLVEMERLRILRWLHEGMLPYGEKSIGTPKDESFWRHMRNLLIHRVRMSEPLAIEVSDIRNDLETVFDSVVAPHRPASTSKKRIDGEITRCLGVLATMFTSRDNLPGYKGRTVRVMRAYRGRLGTVVIEGLNLAASADQNADQLVGRLRRLAAANQPKGVIVGYLASPHGLNGERALIEYVHDQTGARAFDIVRQKDELLDEARALVNMAGEQMPLDDG